MLHDEFYKELARRTTQENTTIDMVSVDCIVRHTPVSCAAKLLLTHFLSVSSGQIGIDVIADFARLKPGLRLKKETIIKCINELCIVGIIDILEINEVRLICRITKAGITKATGLQWRE